jgi:hypothetical protein
MENCSLIGRWGSITRQRGELMEQSKRIIVSARARKAKATSWLPADQKCTCSDQVLRGTYIIWSSGWGPDLQNTPGKFVPFNSVARVTYDGKGGGEGFIVGNVGGTALKATLTETYKVNPDCTVNDELTADVELPAGYPPLQIKTSQFLIIDTDGQEGVAVAVSPDISNPLLPAPQIVSSTMKRIKCNWLK